MLSIKSLVINLIFLLLAILGSSMLIAVVAANASAAVLEGEDDNGDDVTARVVRVSYLDGDVSLQRGGSENWEPAKINLPLVEGDALATGSDGRAEIQVDADNFVRLSSDAALKIVTLRDDGIAFSLSQGTATLRLARFERGRESFELDAPKTTIAAEQSGLYRVDVGQGGNVRVTVRDGGQARIYSETSGFTLRSGRTANLSSDGSGEGDWDLAAAAAFDSWDDWNGEREQFLASRLRSDDRDRYYDQGVWGAEDLGTYGDWSYTGDYGYIWRPHVNAISYYDNWAPYRYGRWTWCRPYGWAWVGDEPWGWAPYHYGRWVNYQNSWWWAPRGDGDHRHRTPWSPGLVAFVYVPHPSGERLCWYPLGYGQPDPRRHHWRRPLELTTAKAGELANLRRTNPVYLRAVSSVPVADFGRQAGRAQPAPADVARRALAGEPVRGILPIRPAVVRNSVDNGTAGGKRTLDSLPVRRGAFDSAASSLARPTGAATRRPGTPLDDELRHARMYRGPSRGLAPGIEQRRSEVDSKTAGAVARSPRPPRRSVESRTETDRSGSANAPAATRLVRAAPEVGRPASPRVYNRTEREDRGTALRPSTPATKTVERPARPERTERTGPVPARPESPSFRRETPPVREAPRAPSRPAETPRRSESSSRSESHRDAPAKSGKSH